MEKKKEIKLNLGCGNQILDGYINIDIREEYRPKKLFDYKNINSINKDDLTKKLLFDFFDQHPCQYPLREDCYRDIDEVELLYPGLGDAVIMTRLPKTANLNNRTLIITSKNNQYLNDLLEYNLRRAHFKDHVIPKKIDNSVFPLNNWGGGHPIQLMEKALGFEPSRKPMGYLDNNLIKSRKNLSKIKIGIGIQNQKVGIQRPLNKSELEIIQEFIDSNNMEYVEFVEFGTYLETKFTGTKPRLNLYTENLIEELGSCDYFIGTASGLMNLAAALEVKSIILANVPDANLFYLPCLVAGNNIPELSWMYPQNVHLHLDGYNELVPKFSLDNLNEAINGNIYPYWGEEYLDLVYEYDKIICDRLYNSFMLNDVRTLPFKYNYVDEIRAIDVYEHISHRESKQLLKHWIDILKPGGVLYIQSPNIFNIVNYFLAAKSREEAEMSIALLYGGQDHIGNFHNTIVDPRLFVDYLKEAGITGTIEFQDVGMNILIRAYK